MKRCIVFLLGALVLLGIGQAQIVDPVKWTFEKRVTSTNTADLIFTATIDSKYHMYGVYFEDGGPVLTTFRFDTVKDIERVGRIIEVTRPHKTHDPNFDMDVTLHSGKAIFLQKIRFSKPGKYDLKGSVEYQACTDINCLRAVEKDFSFNFQIEGEKASLNSVSAKEVHENVIPVQLSQDSKIAPLSAQQPLPVGQENNNKSMWVFFFWALVAGFAGTLTPCVFPMIPMTVSFFMQGSQNRIKGILKGLVFGLSIVGIYTSVGLLVSLTSLGSDFASQLSSHWIPNLIFFSLFLVFAASFLGMFEIVLPSGIVNKADQNADKGGYIGIVFMALATVLVSFSCTGPLVGSLLVEAAGGLALKPIVGMFGFGLAFALPFTFFAIFPSSLKSLPKSGGWLNSVKVVLGIIVLAFSLKFLANIDQSYHLNILSRDIFLAIWIVLAVILGFYILGKIQFLHDSPVKGISVPRFILALVAFVFSVYLLTGLFGKPLKSLSALLPPQEEVTGSSIAPESSNSTVLCSEPLFSDILHFPFGLKGYFTYKEALACAAEKGKPILIDFKGHTCANCKKMEQEVWSNSEVQKLLSNEFVLVALYTDDKAELPAKDWYISKFDGKQKKTMGQVNSDIQSSVFQTNTLPYYVIVNEKGEILNQPIGTELDVNRYIEFLKSGIARSKEMRQAKI